MAEQDKIQETTHQAVAEVLVLLVQLVLHLYQVLAEQALHLQLQVLLQRMQAVVVEVTVVDFIQETLVELVEQMVDLLVLLVEAVLELIHQFLELLTQVVVVVVALLHQLQVVQA
jgi:hypothetical protein